MLSWRRVAGDHREEVYFSCSPSRRFYFTGNIHDGSILDKLFGTKKEQVKVSYAVVMGLTLTALVLSGFWLWYGPKKLRESRQHKMDH